LSLNQSNIVKLLNDLGQQIKERCYTPAGPYLRPFYPNSSWEAARVFIIGLNPVSPLREEFASFDHYWKATTEAPAEFETVCLTKYKCAESERSRTSRRIEEFCKLLHPINVLITNVISYPATNPKLIPAQYRREPASERILSQLIQICKPKVLLFHGREARSFASTLFKVDLDAYLPPRQQKYRVSISESAGLSSIFAYHHLVGRVEVKSVVAEHLKEFADMIHQQVKS
jgi:hypothetical protein